MGSLSTTHTQPWCPGVNSSTVDPTEAQKNECKDSTIEESAKTNSNDALIDQQVLAQDSCCISVKRTFTFFAQLSLNLSPSRSPVSYY